MSCISSCYTRSIAARTLGYFFIKWENIVLQISDFKIWILELGVANQQKLWRTEVMAHAIYWALHRFLPERSGQWTAPDNRTHSTFANAMSIRMTLHTSNLFDCSLFSLLPFLRCRWIFLISLLAASQILVIVFQGTAMSEGINRLTRVPLTSVSLGTVICTVHWLINVLLERVLETTGASGTDWWIVHENETEDR